MDWMFWFEDELRKSCVRWKEYEAGNKRPGEQPATWLPFCGGFSRMAGSFIRRRQAEADTVQAD